MKIIKNENDVDTFGDLSRCRGASRTVKPRPVTCDLNNLKLGQSRVGGKQKQRYRYLCNGFNKLEKINGYFLKRNLS